MRASTNIFVPKKQALDKSNSTDSHLSLGYGTIVRNSDTER